MGILLFLIPLGLICGEEIMTKAIPTDHPAFVEAENKVRESIDTYYILRELNRWIISIRDWVK